MGYSIIETRLEKREIQERIKSVPVNTMLFNLDSTLFVFPKATPVVLVIFNSTCEHCQYELSQIKNNMSNFNNLELVFLSSESISVIKRVALLFESAPNVSFVKINPEHLYDSFGTVRFPTIFIYNSVGTLVKEFKGEVKIDAILEYVR